MASRSESLTLGPSSVRSTTSPGPQNGLVEEKVQPPPLTNTILKGRKLFVVFLSMMLSLLLVALDQTILSTALPRIASDFNAFTLQGWVATSFTLSQTVFILFYGQILRIFSTKWVMIAAIVIFEAGSLLCALSQNMSELIAGRTVSGVGAAGIFLVMFQIIAQSTSLEDRPRLLSFTSAVFGVASVIGPLIGGAFTDHVTWRWCFYINLPFGGLSVLGVLFVLDASPPLGSDPTKPRSRRDILRQVADLDFLGVTLVAAAITCLDLALQWGGNTKAWGDEDVIICFVLAAVAGAVFISWEIHKGERAMTPTSIFRTASVWAILAYSFLSRFALLLYSFYIPIFYQAVLHKTATASGINLIPYMLSIVATIILSGHIASRSGYYHPFLVIGPIFLAIGSGLLYSLTTSTPSLTAKLIGYQILTGIGTGMGMQNSILAIQVEFHGVPKLLGQAMSMSSFAQHFGGTVGLGIAEPVFASLLTGYLRRYAPEAPVGVVKDSPTAIYRVLPEELVAGVVRSYAEALRVVLILGVPVAGLALFAAFWIKNIRIPRRQTVGASKEERGEQDSKGTV
ncbi:major facilitator transporter-like protein [Favolaschia claudopus]|uniref:Major facilitator transporter-like protein n=1 Tax=Favolaschia claudopus TaxID=2862362 RepID=A0AAW0D166_9AGAR